MEKVLKKAIEVWGEDAQINMAIQEMAELIKELTDISRDRTSKEKLATEICDVEILMKQLRIILSRKYDGFEELIEKEKVRKIERIEKILF